MKNEKPDYSVPQLSNEMNFEQSKTNRDVDNHFDAEGVSFGQTVEAEKFFMSNHERKESEYQNKFNNRINSLKGGE